MKIQGIELKYGFKTAEKYDEYAKEHNHSDLLGIVYDYQEAVSILEKKFGKKFDKMKEVEKSEHRMNFPTTQVVSLFSAFAGINDRDKACDILDKELADGVSLPEITAIMVMGLMQSALYSAVKAKAEANPKKPK